MCEALGLELYIIRYYPSFLSFFHTFDIHAKSSDSIYHIISTGRSIAFIAESINNANMATRTVTIVLKNVVQPCRCPFTIGWFFGHTGRDRKCHRVQGSSFPIWLASLPRLKIRELASVLTLVSRYTLLFPILTKQVEFLFRFCLCSGMWPRVDLVEPSTNSLTYRVTMSGRRRAGSTLSSTYWWTANWFKGLSLLRPVRLFFKICLINAWIFF